MKKKIALMVLVACCILGVKLTGIRELYLLAAMAVSMMLIPMVISWLNAGTLNGRQCLKRAVVLKGDKAVLTLQFKNKFIFPIPLVKIAVTGVSGKVEENLSFSSPAFSEKTFQVFLDCPYRGRYAVGMESGSVGDLFGMYRRKLNVRQNNHTILLVYPKVHQLSLKPSGGMNMGEILSLSRDITSDGDVYADLRTYGYGDSLKKIHWKASAKKGELQVKMFEQSVEAYHLVIIDGRPVAQADQAIVLADLCCECAATLIYNLVESGQSVRLLLAGKEFQSVSCSTLAHFQPVHQLLAEVEFASSLSPAEMVAHELTVNRQAGKATIISVRTDEMVSMAAKSLKMAGCEAALVYVSPGQAGERAASPANTYARRITILNEGEIAEKLGELL